ncbi:MAG TPA: LCP family protein [Actinomycetes bacterium]|nr:LCP family protein [Actinomycetes bacterium]
MTLTPTPSPTPTKPPDPWAHRRTYTIAFLGGDGGPNRQGVRTDAVIVAVVDTKSGNTTLIGVPRNLQRMRFRPGTPMARRFPGGFPDFMFGIYTYAQAHRAVVPGSKHPAADLLKTTLSYNLGVRIDNYVLVNMAGFMRLINALDGVQLRVLERIPIGGQKSLDGTRILRYPHDYLEPRLYRNMTGRQTLWFSRSRFGSTDYARMARQRCVLGGLARQIDMRTGLAVFARLAPPRGGVLHTDIPVSMLRKLATLGKRIRSAEITGITLGPPLINGADPDWRKIRSTVRASIARSRDARRDRTRARVAARSGRLQSLDSVCRYR